MADRYIKEDKPKNKKTNESLSNKDHNYSWHNYKIFRLGIQIFHNFKINIYKKKVLDKKK